MKKRYQAKTSAKPQDQKQRESKDKRLLKTVLKNGIISVGVIAVLFAVMKLVQSQQSDQASALSSLEGELRTAQSKAGELKAQIEALGEASAAYAKIVEERSSMDFMIDPLSIRPMLMTLKTKYYITNLNIEFSQRAELPIKNLTLTDLQPAQYDVQITISSVSDAFIYQFMSELNERAPGVLLPISTEMKRVQPMTIEVLSKVGRGLKVETASGVYRSKWYGFVPKEAAPTNGGGV